MFDDEIIWRIEEIPNEPETGIIQIVMEYIIKNIRPFF